MSVCTLRHLVNFLSVHPARHADDLLLLNGGQDNMVSDMSNLLMQSLSVIVTIL